MATDKQTKATGSRRLLLCALGASLVALVVYACSLAGYLMPGDATHLYTQWAGLDALPLPSHPLWGGLVKCVGGWTCPFTYATRLNCVSLICGALAAGLLCYLVGFFVKRTVRQEDAVRYAGSAALVAGCSAAFVFIFSTAVWQSSVILDYRIFDICLALVLFAFLVPMAHCRKVAFALGSAALGAGLALGVVESEIFVALAPLYLLALVVTAVKAGRRPYLPVSLFLLALVVVYLVVFAVVANGFLARPSAAAGRMTDVGSVWKSCATAYAHEIRTWFSSVVPGYPPDLRKMWLVVLAFSVLPFTACMFASPRGLNNERTWSQYLFHLAISLCVLIGIATPASPEGLLRRFGISPVATTTLVAVAAGYLAAYWYLLARVPVRVNESTKEIDPVVRVGRRMAPAILIALGLLVALSALVNGFTTTRDRGSYASVCANALLDRMGSRTWLVTSGLLDDHLRAAAATRGQTLNLVCLHRDSDEAYLRELTDLVKEKKPGRGGTDLAMSAQLGVLTFLQDWFADDTNVLDRVAIFGVPDLWYLAHAKPVPDGLVFRGVADFASFDAQKAYDDFVALWKSLEPVLFCEKGKGSRAILDAIPSDAMRLQLRRHIGFLGNNLAVVLQDVKKDALAWKIYDLVHKTIDPDNVSTLFNEFEMARAGVPEAVSQQRAIEREIKAIVDDPKRRYAMWSLSRYYGYIRSAEMFTMMGFGWARSALPGVAIEMATRGTDLVPAERQDGLLLQLAMAYANNNQAAKSRETYEKLLAKNVNSHEARMGLAQLALARGDVAEAKKQLGEAVRRNRNTSGAGFDWALLHMLNNDLGAARMSLQKLTDMQPKSMQAWALLAGVLLQRLDGEKDPAKRTRTLTELDTVILPKMQLHAEGPRDYHVQTTRGLVLLRKADGAADKKEATRLRREARDAFVVASTSRPEISSVGDMVLNLDIQLDDTENAERHARQILRQDRRNKLANYVLGSIRLKNGEYVQAEAYLRRSVEAEKPLAAAQNDLAETLHRRGDFKGAETYARAATVTDPKLYVAWETLASTLLDQNRNLDEAETCVKKAIAIAKETLKTDDVRMLLTLARVQIARKDAAHANATLRTLRGRQKELSSYDVETLEKLQRLANIK